MVSEGCPVGKTGVFEGRGGNRGDMAKFVRQGDRGRNLRERSHFRRLAGGFRWLGCGKADAGGGRGTNDAERPADRAFLVHLRRGRGLAAPGGGLFVCRHGIDGLECSFPPNSQVARPWCDGAKSGASESVKCCGISEKIKEHLRNRRGVRGRVLRRRDADRKPVP